MAVCQKYWYEREGIRFRLLLTKNGISSGMYVGNTTQATGIKETSHLTYIRSGNSYMRYNLYSLALRKADLIIKSFPNYKGLGVRVEYFTMEAQDEHTLQK